MPSLFGSRELLPLPMIPVFATGNLNNVAIFKAGGTFVAPWDGTIDRIACYCSAITGAPPNYRVELQGVTGGAPSGGTIGVNTSATFAPVAATLHVLSLTASHAVQAGDLIATSLFGNTAPDASNFAAFNIRNASSLRPTGIDPLHHPRAANDTTGAAWVQLAGLPTIVPVYSDGRYLPNCVPRGTAASTNFNSGTNPDERGSRWTQLGNASCIGARFYTRQAVAGSDLAIKLYPLAADNVAPLVSKSISAASYFFGTTNDGIGDMFWDGVDLTDGLDYRITIVPTTANNLRYQIVQYPNADIRRAVSHFKATSRLRTADADDGAWTDVEEDYIAIWPIFGQGNGNLGAVEVHNTLITSPWSATPY